MLVLPLRCAFLSTVFAMSVFALGVLSPSVEAGDRSLSLEQTSGRGERVRFSGNPLRVRWAPDGVHLSWRDGEERVQEHPLTQERISPETPTRDRAPEDRPSLRSGFERLPGFTPDAARRAARAIVDRQKDARLVRFESDLYFERGDGEVHRLTDDAAKEEESSLSPDGRTAAFIREYDLHFIDTASGRERAITGDGSDTVFNGRLDWVYQEEVYGRGNFRGYWWSPSSRHVAFLRLDEERVPVYTVMDHIPYDGKAELTRYPKAGAANPKVTVGVASVRGGGVTWLDLERFGEPEAILVVRVGWSPDGNKVILMVQDRIQTWLELCEADPRTGKVTTLIREDSKGWVNRLPAPRWLEDGSFLWMSDRTGYRHLYHYAADGELLRAVTQGLWSVRSILRLDEKRKQVFFTGTRGGAVNSHAYRVDLNGEGFASLTQDAGSHRITLNGESTLYLDRFSSVETPPEMRLCDISGKILRRWTAEIPDLDRYAFSRAELFEVKARDGFVLDVMLIRPPGFDPGHRYGVWLPTYSGPNSPSVRNSWQSSTWDQFLAQQGFLVFRVNVRSASGRGQATTETCYKQLGVQELRDLEDAVGWLCSHPWADGDRVGISGWSYGGFMSAYALTHSDRFALGVAGAGVYDWRCYDSIYTERYMSTPQANPEGYRRSSCTEAAADLKGHLVILHGTMDDNVHMQNAMQFVFALQKAEKSFELMLYPRSRHGIRHPEQRWNQRKLTWSAISKVLGITL